MRGASCWRRCAARHERRGLRRRNAWQSPATRRFGPSSVIATTKTWTGEVAQSPVARGEFWLAALDPTVGSEIEKTRPRVIVSPPEMHDFLRTVTVAPMTTGSHPDPIAFRFGSVARPG